jgi:hypothetical protein
MKASGHTHASAALPHQEENRNGSTTDAAVVTTPEDGSNSGSVFGKWNKIVGHGLYRHSS